jgi:dGTPase
MPDATLREERLHEKKIKPEDREPAARDRDRILYCSAFRRLAEVTQVVAAETGHVFHNRLTHSLQVAQVGRRLAERLQNNFSAEIASSAGLNPNVVEAACLAHDLGHPPFGHTAEEELNRLTKDIGGFEGNAQSFRIVTKLAFRKKGIEGLDLTRATLAGILKYPWLRGENKKKEGKWGAYGSETDDFYFARVMEPESLKRTIEAELMDWADDVTYAVHDMEDFYRSGRIPLHSLTSESDGREREYFFKNTFERLSEKDSQASSRRSDRENAFKGLVEYFSMERPYSGVESQRAALRNLSSVLIDRYITAVKLEVVDGKSKVVIDQNYLDEILMLKELTWTYVIQAPSLASQQHGQRKIIENLFFEYCTAAIGDTDNKVKKHPEIFPPYYQERLQTASADEDRKRICVDLIAGMTEKQAVATHLRLTGTALGSGLEEYLS